ncbi:MAG TPA: bifunctional prephenate dehydrogenase/3-phosphoshikimate 1-carboxyvinyltransferase [Porticoccaceae bacterium]|nr:bifunctional prephenate dehydrogenase/3-phosphoshikimate 1-carboxyvinyltransferase [Porticoccaceae bacterium]
MSSESLDVTESLSAEPQTEPSKTRPSKNEPLFDRLLVIGLGLIGGSLALAARDRRVAREVIGASRSPSTLKRALERGVVDGIAEELPAALARMSPGDIVVIAVPTLTVPTIMRELYSHLPKGVTFTDAASVKGSVVAAVRDIYGALPAEFVPGHPIAGSEKSGIDAVNPTLYEHHQVIITPLTATADDHIERVCALWRSVGASIQVMSVDEHDEVLASTSHLPHLLAYALVDTLAGMEENREIFRYAAGGFRDFTRIAASDPVMWRDIVVANNNAIVSVLDRLLDRLGDLRQAVVSCDSDELLGTFTRAQAARNHFQKMLDRRPYMETEPGQQLRYRAQAGRPIIGDVRVPGDKSMSHRAIILGSIAEGVTRINGFLEGEDSLATLQAFRDMGVVIEGPTDGAVAVHGVGLHGLKAPSGPLYLGNSGTSMRLLAGLMSGQAFDSELTGDESLSGRPMRRVADPLRTMGAQVDTAEGDTPPLRIGGGRTLRAIDYELPMASAQVKSCVMLAGLYAEGETTVAEPAPTRDHTERMLRGFGYPVEVSGGCVRLRGGGRLQAGTVDIPGDISSAAFFLVGASITAGSDLMLRHVGINPTRTGIINILKMMGADIELSNETSAVGEPVADIRVRGAQLRGVQVPETQVPLAIDEFPAICIAAACARGTTVVTGAEELRVKESDRIQAMADGLNTLGITVQTRSDGIVIQGGQLMGGEVDSCGDHRIAMAFTIAGTQSDGPVLINNCNNVATSFPGFIELAQSLGIDVIEEVLRV